MTLGKNSTVMCAHIVQHSMCILNLQHHVYMPAYCTLQSHHHACHFVLLPMCSFVTQWHSPYRLVGGVSTRAFFDVAFFSQAHTQHVIHREWVEASKTYNLVIYCQHETCKSKKNGDSYGKFINHEQP